MQQNNENPENSTEATGEQKTEYDSGEAMDDSASQSLSETAANENESDTVISLRIVDGAGEGTLILAGEGENEVYSLSVADIPVYLDGKKADADVLEDGMKAEISYGGDVLETFPAMLGNVSAIHVYSLGTARNPGGSTYDLAGLYLKVLRDLWNTDKGLNDNCTYISIVPMRYPKKSWRENCRKSFIPV